MFQETFSQQKEEREKATSAFERGGGMPSHTNIPQIQRKESPNNENAFLASNMTSEEHVLKRKESANGNAELMHKERRNCSEEFRRDGRGTQPEARDRSLKSFDQNGTEKHG